MTNKYLEKIAEQSTEGPGTGMRVARAAGRGILEAVAGSLAGGAIGGAVGGPNGAMIGARLGDVGGTVHGVYASWQNTARERKNAAAYKKLLYGKKED